MRLRELKCKNCGASIKVDENETQVECKYCHTTFVVEDAYHYGYKFEKGRMRAHSEQLERNFEHARSIIGPIGKIFAAQYIISAVICMVIFIIAIVTIIVFATKQINSTDEFNVSSFNNHYEIYNGTKYEVTSEYDKNGFIYMATIEE